MAGRTERRRYAEFGADGKNDAMVFDTMNDPLGLKNLADDSRFAPERKELSALVRAYAEQYDPAKGR